MKKISALNKTSLSTPLLLHPSASPERFASRYRLPDKDFGLRYRSSTYDLYDFLALPCQNHYLEVYSFAVLA